LNPLSAVYGTLARARRARYARHPHLRRRLHHPVISIGNLVVGGSGKTPAVAAVARMLKDAGERPAILSRGYARRVSSPEPLVVSDTSRVLADVQQSGDEPQMLARALPGVPVIVGADRYASGGVAEQQLHATVLLLDDGFQHLPLARDVDLLVMSPADLGESTLPSGRLREPLSAARDAHALIVRGSDDDARHVSVAMGVPAVFRLEVMYEAPRHVVPDGQAVGESAGRRVVAVAGIARPERFFTALREQGWDVVRQCAFRDHYWFTAADVQRITGTMREIGADLIITTEKDAMRLAPLLQPGSAERTRLADDVRAYWAYLPMRVSIEPEAAFGSWLAARLAAARASAEQHA
jgi:tetraacyldisaccharide 4'-kinase